MTPAESRRWAGLAVPLGFPKIPSISRTLPEFCHCLAQLHQRRWNFGSRVTFSNSISLYLIGWILNCHTKQCNKTYQTLSVSFWGDLTYSKLHLRTIGSNACNINLIYQTKARTDNSDWPYNNRITAAADDIINSNIYIFYFQNIAVCLQYGL